MTCNQDCAMCDEVQELTHTFPYPIGTTLYSPTRFQGKVSGVDRYEVIGYSIDARGMAVKLLPLSYDGIATSWLIKDLYLTEQEAWEA